MRCCWPAVSSFNALVARKSLVLWFERLFYLQAHHFSWCVDGDCLLEATSACPNMASTSDIVSRGLARLQIKRLLIELESPVNVKYGVDSVHIDASRAQ